jgi:hypothetical protein
MSNDTSIATAGLKVCCACGADVNGQPRMKDSKGRYWCVPCGEADQRKKQITSTTAPCAGCHKPFPKSKLEPHASAWFCKSCLKKVKSGKAPVHAAGSDSSSTGTWHMGPGIAASTTNTDRPTLGHGHAGGAGRAEAPTTDRKRLVIMASVLAALIVLAVVINFMMADY